MNNIKNSKWNYESIEQRLRENLDKQNLSYKELKEKLIRLKTAVYPIRYVLSSLDELHSRGTYADSKLFPYWEKDEDNFSVIDEETRQIEKVDLKTKDLDRDYLTSRSLVWNNNSEKLPDSLEVLSVHGEGYGTYESCGIITMADIRHLEEIYRETSGNSDAK